ncbi:phage tail assembly protein [Kistimonas scapharcae]|uniref:Phage tail assembly protein n=2 Tax=Kistimonas scapharcae TaxID=1036133 RepID=A0ABP8V7Z2_9GAMM
MTFELKDGLRIGEGDTVEIHRTVKLRQLGAGDVIDAMQASERVIPTPDGYQMVQSPSLMGLELLRRQVKKLGAINGPLSFTDLAKLSSRDLKKLQDEVEKLDAAVAKELEARGRVQPAGAGA